MHFFYEYKEKPEIRALSFTNYNFTLVYFALSINSKYFFISKKDDTLQKFPIQLKKS